MYISETLERMILLLNI